MNQSNISLIWTVKSFDELDNSELYEILALRNEVFVFEQNCAYQDLDFKDQKSLHLMGKLEDGSLIAYSRLFGLDEYFKGYMAIGRVITDAKFRKYGFGIDLMKESVKKCYEIYGKQPIKIGAQKYLTKFYSILGFKEIGEDYMEDGIPHCIMVKEI